MGTAIINGIKDGFGLLGDLAQNLLTAFSTLFLDTTGTNPALTSLGWFMLIMFGLTITVGALKLALNIIRNRG